MGLFVKSETIRQISYLSGIILLSFSLSWLSPLLISVLVKTNAVEIFFMSAIALLLYSKKEIGAYFITVLKSREFKVCAFIIFMFFVLGFAKSGGDFMSTYADFRANVIFVFFYILIGRYVDWDESLDFERSLVYIMVLVSILDVIALKLRPYFGQDFTKQTISIIIPAVLSIYFIRKDKFVSSIIFLGVVCYEASVCFFRNYFIVAILLFLMITVTVIRNMLSIRRSSSRFKSLLLIFVVIVAIIYISPIIYDYWNSDPSRQVHSINRTEEFLNGSGTETERINSIDVVINNPLDFIIPHGIGWRAFHKDIERDFIHSGIISTMDSCFFYLSYHYGLILTIALIFFSSKSIVGSFLMKKRSDILFSKVFIFCFLLLFCSSFFTQGVMFTILQASFSYALLLGLIVNPR